MLESFAFNEMDEGFQVHWQYSESQMTEREEEKLIEEIKESFSENVSGSGKPIQKSLEEGLALSALTLAVNGIDALIGVYQLLHNHPAIKRIDVQPRNPKKHVFQTHSKQVQEVEYGEDMNVNNIIVEDSDITIVVADVDDAREVQKKLETADAHVNRINQNK